MWGAVRRLAAAARPCLSTTKAPIRAPSTPWSSIRGFTGARSFFTEIKRKPIASDDLAVADVVNKDISERNAESGLGKDLFTVVHCGGKQFKVSTGDVLVVENMAADVGSLINLNKVLMVGSKEFTVVGAPLLDANFASVHARVMEKTRSRRQIVYKFKRRKRYRKKIHHRHVRVLLQVEAISLSPTLVASDGITGEPLKPPTEKGQAGEPRFKRLQASLNTTQKMGPELSVTKWDHDLSNDDDLLEKAADNDVLKTQ